MISVESARSFGDCFVIEQRWRQLGLDRVFAMAPQDLRLELDVELLYRCMVTNRLIWPISRIRAAVETLGSRTFRVRTEPTLEAVAILKACRVQLPPRIEELTDERKARR